MARLPVLGFSAKNTPSYQAFREKASWPLLRHTVNNVG